MVSCPGPRVKNVTGWVIRKNESEVNDRIANREKLRLRQVRRDVRGVFLIFPAIIET
jgi:hypothetical protein